MKELNDEIKLTLNLMQAGFDEGAHSELQYHMACLLEIKRNEIQQRLAGSQAELAKPLTIGELQQCGWWCADVSEESRLAFIKKGLNTQFTDWTDEDEYKYCYLAGTTGGPFVVRTDLVLGGLKQIHRIGNDFYWS